MLSIALSGGIKTREPRQNQTGFMLVEVLVSILLFAFGCVALMGLQARSFGISSDVQIRAEAMHLANAYVGEMWAAGLGSATTPVQHSAFLSGGAYFKNFTTKVLARLPGASEPAVDIGIPEDLNATSRLVTVTLTWADQDNPDEIHRYSQTNIIGLN